jgi:hypothetical protein
MSLGLIGNFANPTVTLGPIDIHFIQIIAAARWMKPVKLSVRLS